jgi:hypothetical protein
VTRPLRHALLALSLAACSTEHVAPTLPAVALTSPCPGSDEAFAFRALRLIEGRRPHGVRELAVLAGFVRRLDAAGLPGRELVARGLTRNDRYLARWRTFLLDHLQVPRLGSTAHHACYGHPGPAAADPRLAAHLRDHGPDVPVPPDLSGWTLADLFDSSLRLDDPTPLLRAHLLAREQRPLGGNNVSDVDLERARRVHLGRGFEAAYLGRRLECLACHDSSDHTPVDSDDPALDRSWPVLPGLEDSVYGPPAGRDEDRSYAAFRIAHFLDGPLRPWGWGDCGGVDPGRAGDPLAIAGHLAGPLPPGAHALDLEARLRGGFDLLREDGLAAAADDPTASLAAMVALNLADAVWREAAGRPLTMAHGQPRNEHQRRVLSDLSERFIGESFSLRELVVAVAIHPYLDLAEPDSCAGALPPVLDPFAADNHAGDGLRREDPWRLFDAAADALGWPTHRRFPLPYGWSDEPLVRALGVYLDDSEPGHRGHDLVGALAWEAATAAAVDPDWRGELPQDHDPTRDVIGRFVDLARADPSATVEELALALQDRLLQETAFTAAERPAISALLALPLDARAADLPADALERALRRLAGALLSAPQFVLAGLPPPPGSQPPRLVLPDATTAALCERYAPAILGDLPDARWRCDEHGVTLID